MQELEREKETKVPRQLQGIDGGAASAKGWLDDEERQKYVAENA